MTSGCFIKLFTKLFTVALIAVYADIIPAHGESWSLRQLTTDTTANHGITIAGTPFSADGQWICYDSAKASIRDASLIKLVNVAAGMQVTVYDAKSVPGAGPGVAAVRYFPGEDRRVIFIHGPVKSTGLTYERWRRFGAIVDTRTHALTHADARDVTPPFTPGALRGGTHVHVPGGPSNQWIGFTYDDAVMTAEGESIGKNWDVRTVGVTRLGIPVHVDADAENWDGAGFSVVLAQVTPDPRPGTDDLRRAEGDCWVGREGYEKEGKLQMARAFVGTLSDGARDVFVVDIPDDITDAGAAPLEGTKHTYPAPPKGTTLRRLTRVGTVSGDVRSKADGTLLVFHAKDSTAKEQLFSMPTTGGAAVPLTAFADGVNSDACFHSSDQWLAVASGNRLYRVYLVKAGDTPRVESFYDGPLPGPPMNLSFSPDGSRLAMNLAVNGVQQVFVLERSVD
ncbi:MAG: DUF3748 domain-containing protein [Candidatus Hydrogenedentes bacterium]|nr:DUF3748 domain-containing protein [Candidatus Hydrogenedentota bacterium]